MLTNVTKNILAEIGLFSICLYIRELKQEDESDGNFKYS